MPIPGPSTLAATILLGLLPGARAGPPADPFRARLSELRVEVAFFDPDRRVTDRSLDLSVVPEGGDADAEGLMTSAQACRLLRRLESDGFFARAKDLRGASWGPQPSPFYVVSVRTDGPAVYELRLPGPGLAALLASLRDALDEGPAARAMDGLVARNDPSRRRWPPPLQGPPAPPPPLPAGASELHPRHDFRPIDPGWRIERAWLRVMPDGAHRLVAPPDDTSGLFLRVEYRVAGANEVVKSVTYFPSGRVFEEVDSEERTTPMLPPRGDRYTRAFREDGTLALYEHRRDGRCLDGVALGEDGTRETVVDGVGTLTTPGELGASTRSWFVDGGEAVCQVRTAKDGRRDVWLRVAWGAFSASSGTERLSKRHGETGWGESWTFDGNGSPSFEPGESGAGPDAGSLDAFLAQRKEFFACVAETLARGGFKLEDAGLEELAARPVSRSASRPPAPAPAPPC